MPVSEEVSALDTRRAVASAHDQLARAKGSFSDKFERLRRRASAVQREQEKLRKNLSKYNNFVREKEAKVAGGERVWQEQRAFQSQIDGVLRDQEEAVRQLNIAKVFGGYHKSNF